MGQASGRVPGAVCTYGTGATGATASPSRASRRVRGYLPSGIVLIVSGAASG